MKKRAKRSFFLSSGRNRRGGGEFRGTLRVKGIIAIIEPLIATPPQLRRHQIDQPVSESRDRRRERGEEAALSERDRLSEVPGGRHASSPPYRGHTPDDGTGTDAVPALPLHRVRQDHMETFALQAAPLQRHGPGLYPHLLDRPHPYRGGGPTGSDDRALARPGGSESSSADSRPGGRTTSPLPVGGLVKGSPRPARR